MKRSSRVAGGFTIIELLTVVAIIGLLIGLLLPAIAGVKRRALKTAEVNNIRQVGTAWQTYASSNNGAALPGYISEATQASWGVVWDYEDGRRMPRDIAATYPWRLAPYLSDTLHTYTFHLDNDDFDLDDDSVRREIALAPPFGYNAYYVGGWWQSANAMLCDHAVSRPLYDEDGVVARFVDQIDRPVEMVVFCSSSVLKPDEYHDYSKIERGAHMVVPPFLADQPMWGIGTGGEAGAGGGGAAVGGESVSILDVYVETAVPIGRYNDRPAIYFADGHTDTPYAGELFSPNNWLARVPDDGNSGQGHTILPWTQ